MAGGSSARIQTGSLFVRLTGIPEYLIQTNYTVMQKVLVVTSQLDYSVIMCN